MLIPTFRALRAAAITAAIASAAACGESGSHESHGHGDSHTDHSSPHDEASHDGHHEHHALHGGTLVVLGEEFAHLELILDAATGKLTLWTLDGEAENAVRVSQTTVRLKIGSGADACDLDLVAVGSALTGETSGNTSQFEGSSPRLVGLKRFDGTVESVTVKGQSFEKTAFRYPEGNE